MLESGSHATTVAVFGLGRVGLVSAACLAAIGHRIQGFDSDVQSAQRIREGNCPFAEPGLESRLQQVLAAGNLSVAASVAEALHNADIAMVCVGTPARPDGSADLSQLHVVLEEIARAKERNRTPLVVAIRSTVFAGVGESAVEPRLHGLPHVSIVMHPEFMREGVALNDFANPALCIVGGALPAAVDLVASLYAPLGITVHCTSARTAEMVKILSNAFHALKVAFANEAGSVGVSAGVDMEEAMAIFCQDRLLNISPAYLRPGMPFGGSCLTKDLLNLSRHAIAHKVSAPLLDAVLASNGEHLERMAQAALALPGEHLGLIGLSFKDETGDLRDSPLQWLFDRLKSAGRSVRYYDPLVEDRVATNRAHRLRDLLAWSDALILGKGLSPAERSLVEEFPGPCLDARVLPPPQGRRYTSQPAKAGS